MNTSKGTESLIRLTLEATNCSAFSPNLFKMFFISIQQQKLQHNLQRVQNAHHPNLDVRYSTFSENDDFILDAFRKGLVMD